jgi:hypothetical protein
MRGLVKRPVEILFAGRDYFGTAITLALVLLPRRAPLWHRFVPHYPRLPHLCPVRLQGELIFISRLAKSSHSH